jgi:mRNA-degrading endonuclease toxin of MazEF toxin-antitoxin module
MIGSADAGGVPVVAAYYAGHTAVRALVWSPTKSAMMLTPWATSNESLGISTHLSTTFGEGLPQTGPLPFHPRIPPFSHADSTSRRRRDSPRALLSPAGATPVAARAATTVTDAAEARGWVPEQGVLSSRKDRRRRRWQQQQTPDQPPLSGTPAAAAPPRVAVNKPRVSGNKQQEPPWHRAQLHTRSARKPRARTPRLRRKRPAVAVAAAAAETQTAAVAAVAAAASAAAEATEGQIRKSPEDSPLPSAAGPELVAVVRAGRMVSPTAELEPQVALKSQPEPQPEPQPQPQTETETETEPQRVERPQTALGMSGVTLPQRAPPATQRPHTARVRWQPRGAQGDGDGGGGRAQAQATEVWG